MQVTHCVEQLTHPVLPLPLPLPLHITDPRISLPFYHDVPGMSLVSQMTVGSVRTTACNIQTHKPSRN